MSLNPLITNVNPTQSLYSAFGAGAFTSQLTVSSIIVAPPNGSPDSGLIVFENATPSTSGGVIFYKDAANQEPVLIGPALGVGGGVIGIQSATSSIFETLAVGELQIYGPAGSTFSNAVRLIGDVNGNLTVSSALYTHLVDVDAVSTTVLDIDGQTLTATPTELLLNGVPLATTSNLSSIADWALDPAISTVQMNGNDLVGARLGFFSTLFSDTAVFNDLSTFTLTAQNTVHVISTVSSSVVNAELGNFSTLNTGALSSPEIQVSTLYATSFLSTPDIEVSTINGATFGSSSITVEVMGVSSLVATSISSLTGGIREALVSTLQLNVNPQFNPSLSGSVDLGLGSLFGNLAGAASGVLGVVVGGAALGTGIAALTQTRQTNNINSNSFELVNGTTQLQISTLGTAFSTIYRFVSSVSENVPGEEYFVSSIHSPGVAIRSVSDPLNTISSPLSTIQSYGQWVALDANLPIPSTISSFQQLFTSSLAVSTMLAEPGVGVRGGAPFNNSPSGISTLEVFEAGAPQYSGALRANQINFSFAGLTSNDYTQDVLLFSQGGNNRLTTGSGRVIAYLSDILSSFTNASISSATISSVNGGIPYTTANPQPTATVSSFTNLFTQNLNASTLSMTQGVIGGISSLNGYPFSEILNPFEDPTPEFSSVTISSTGALSFVSNGVLSGVSSLNGGIPYTTAFPPSASESFSTIYVSSIKNLDSNILINNTVSGASFQINAAGDIIGIGNDGYVNFQTLSSGIATSGMVINPTGAGGQGSFCNYTNGPLSLNASSIRMSTNLVSMVSLSTGNLNIGSALFSTSVAAGSQSQPAGRLVLGGNDFDLGQNDLWCQQIRLGAGNATNAQTEILFYDASANIRGLNTALQDRTIRVISTVNGTTGGYLLDTAINAPFFSTINAQTNLMAFFPSSINSTIGVSTISVIPQITYYASAYSSTSQTVLGANTLTPISYNTITKNATGFTIQGSTIAVPVAGTYEIIHSVQFNTTSGSQNVVDFWLVKNGATVPQTGSRVTVANNAQNLGTVSYYDTAVAGDTYGCAFASADTNMSAGAFGATGIYPAIPSLITNIRWLGST